MDTPTQTSTPTPTSTATLTPYEVAVATLIAAGVPAVDAHTQVSYDAITLELIGEAGAVPMWRVTRRCDGYQFRDYGWESDLRGYYPGAEFIKPSPATSSATPPATPPAALSTIPSLDK